MWRDGEVKCLHYIIEKPWEKRYGPDIADEKEKLDCAELHRWWWIAYRELENEMKVSERKGWELADRYVRHS
jgi:inositol 3-alpha-galactosyltransferase